MTDRLPSLQAEPPTTPLPHPIPYQGSKRQLAAPILSFFPRSVRTLYEPCVGSAAVTIAAAHRRAAKAFVIGDTLDPLCDLWLSVIEQPESLARHYEAVWTAQLGRDRAYYDEIRARFNREHDPAQLLYLLARCVKNSPRFNSVGDFNQSPDKRRLGMRPTKMRREIMLASTLLRGKTSVVCQDLAATAEMATEHDLVYLDPPYQGTSEGHNKRYAQGVDRSHLIEVLKSLTRRGVPTILSYDGRCGAKVYGERLPAEVGLVRLDIHAGRSTQATLHGRDEVTVESLYVSPALVSASRRDTRSSDLLWGLHSEQRG